MNNDLTKLRSILFGKLKPWGNRDTIQEKFKLESKSVETIDPQFDSFYTLTFFKAHTQKAKYYKKLIDTECTRYINTVHYLADKAEDDDLKHYWIFTTLQKKLHQFFIDFAKELERRNYQIEYIDPDKDNKLKDTQISEETFIIHYLKTTLIYIYMEIQAAFPDDLEEEPLDIEDIYRNFFGEPDSYAFIKPLEQIEKVSKSNPKPKPKTAKQSTSFHSLSYIHFPTAPDNITDLWDSLKKNNLISQDTSIHAFKKVFSGKEITESVIWTGLDSDLYYFFYLIYTKHKLVSPMRQQQWKVLCKCFVQEDGTSFNPDSIRLLKRPKTTGEIIEACVNHLK
jgi:hypothetical protein